MQEVCHGSHRNRHPSHCELEACFRARGQERSVRYTFSATSEAALPYATAICRRFGSTLHLVHVLSDAGLLMMSGGVDYVSMGTIYEDAENEAKEKLEQISAQFETIPHRTYVRHGQVWKNLAVVLEANGII